MIANTYAHVKQNSCQQQQQQQHLRSAHIATRSRSVLDSFPCFQKQARSADSRMSSSPWVAATIAPPSIEATPETAAPGCPSAAAPPATHFQAWYIRALWIDLLTRAFHTVSP